MIRPQPGVLHRAGIRLLDFLLPPQCLTCDAGVDAHGRFCAACFGRIGFVTAPSCVRCGVPFSHAGQGAPGSICPGCRATPPPWGRACGALRYDEASRKILLPFKHGDRTEHAAALAAMMLRAGGPLLEQAELLVPVPLHRRRLAARRYNQAALLAHRLGRLAGRAVIPDALRRLRATRVLGELSAERRVAELAGAFGLRPSATPRIAGRRVLLIDDVMTSGATAAACAIVLLAGGASAVDVLVAARVPDPQLA